MLDYNDFCCEPLKRSIERGEMIYDEVYASVQFYINSQPWYKENAIYRKHANYCPYCGTKLHMNLNGPDDIYRNELEKAVGKEYCDITEDEIPEEFKSDEWWKKRGL